MKKSKTQSKSKDFLAIEFTDRCIQALTGVPRRNGVVVYDAFRVAVPLGCVSDGEVRDVERLTTIINNEVLSRASTRNVAFVTDSATVVKRRFFVPAVDESDLDGLVSSKLGEYLGLNMESYVVHYAKTGVTGQAEEGTGNTNEVYACAMPRRITDQLYNLTQSLGVEPVLLNAGTNSIQKLVAQGVTINGNLTTSGYERVAFLEICDRSLRINIYDNGHFFYSSAIPMGVADIIDEISISLRVEFADAAKALFDLLRKVNNIFRTDFSRGGFSPLQLQVVEIINNQIFHWLDEVKKVFLLYSGGRGKDIQVVFMHGVGCDFNGLDYVFSGELGKDVFIIRDMGNIANPSKNEELAGFMYRYVNLIGLIAN